MIDFDLWLKEALKDNPNKISIASNFIWYHFTIVSSEGISIKEINEYFEKSHLPKYNTTLLKDDLRKTRNITNSAKKGCYKPTRDFIEELNNKYSFISVKSEDIITDNTIIPDTLYINTRGYIENLSKQINASYEHNIFDGCAVLMRRLFEILLIHSYEHIGKIDEIKENDGFKNLSYIINYTISNKPFTLSKEAIDALDEFRQLGNFSAHKIQYNAKRKDIHNIRLLYRLVVEELLYASGIKK